MDEPLIPPHGGYEGLAAFRMAEVVYDATVAYCERYHPRLSRMTEQMLQAARSGRQNIAEGSQASGTSKKMEVKPIGVARASLEELRLDFEDALRQNGLRLWTKDEPKALFIKKLCYREDRSYKTYRTYIEDKGLENAANTMVCLIRQARFLLDRLLRRLEADFERQGGFTERLYHHRKRHQTEGPAAAGPEQLPSVL
jgi:four helix bundle suffix protein